MPSDHRKTNGYRELTPKRGLQANCGLPQQTRRENWILKPIATEILARRHETIDGIEMGILEDGTPYLSARGLAELCGIALSTLTALDQKWSLDTAVEGRNLFIAQRIEDSGHKPVRLFVTTERPDGKTVKAHPDYVCMAVLDYFAFESRSPSRRAQDNFRRLARRSLREFIFTALGYNPKNSISNIWRNFHDRMLLNRVPKGYFSVFQETSGMVLSLIQHGMEVNQETVPDISVGQTWSQHWKGFGLDGTFGERKKFPHKYPAGFPQSGANAFIEAWVYPISALGEFRGWLGDEYMEKKFGKYLKARTKKGSLPASSAQRILEAVRPREFSDALDQQAKLLEPWEMESGKHVGPVAECRDSEILQALEPLASPAITPRHCSRAVGTERRATWAAECRSRPLQAGGHHPSLTAETAVSEETRP